MANKIIPSRQSSIVGLVSDVHRHMEVSKVFSLVNICSPLIDLLQGHHYAEITSVFGLDMEEFDCLKNAGLKIKPSKFERSEDRFQVGTSLL